MSLWKLTICIVNESFELFSNIVVVQMVLVVLCLTGRLSHKHHYNHTGSRSIRKENPKCSTTFRNAPFQSFPLLVLLHQTKNIRSTTMRSKHRVKAELVVSFRQPVPSVVPQDVRK